MERTLDKEEDIAAPMVPEESAKAAEQKEVKLSAFMMGRTHRKNCDQGWVRIPAENVGQVKYNQTSYVRLDQSHLDKYYGLRCWHKLRESMEVSK